MEGVWVNLGTLEGLANKSGTLTNELRTLVSIILSTQFDEALGKLLPDRA